MAISAGVELAIPASLSDQLLTLRRTFDERLSALEAGLSDPDQCPSLEALILDLTRVAVEEAEAAARDIIRQSRREAAEQTAAATADAQEAHTRLEAERALAVSLRTEVAALTEKLTKSSANRDAVAALRDLVAKEGIFAGPSSGAVLIAATRVARQLGSGTVVALLPDGGWKYLSAGTYERDLDEMEDDLEGGVNWW